MTHLGLYCTLSPTYTVNRLGQMQRQSRVQRRFTIWGTKTLRSETLKASLISVENRQEVTLHGQLRGHIPLIIFKSSIISPLYRLYFNLGKFNVFTCSLYDFLMQSTSVE